PVPRHRLRGHGRRPAPGRTLAPLLQRPTVSRPVADRQRALLDARAPLHPRARDPTAGAVRRPRRRPARLGPLADGRLDDRARPPAGDLPRRIGGRARLERRSHTARLGRRRERLRPDPAPARPRPLPPVLLALARKALPAAQRRAQSIATTGSR